MAGVFDRQFVCIVGAPRCGTTSLARFLTQHPQICFSRVKEPHYFSGHDFRGLQDSELRDALSSDYLPRYFPHLTNDHRILAEGSVSYLYMRDRVEPVLEAWPNAKFIIAVRDPIEMLPSLHQRLLYQGDESIRDFSKAWDMRLARAEGKKIPLTCIDARALQYEELGSLGKHVAAFVDTVGRERCFIAVYDDLMARPERLYQRLLSFLELPLHDTITVPVSRKSKGYRFGWLQRLLKRPPHGTRRLLAGRKFSRRIKPLKDLGPSALAAWAFRLRGVLLRWNRTSAPDLYLPNRVRNEIREALADDIQTLSRFLERDLSHWLGGIAPSSGGTERPVPPGRSDPRLTLDPREEHHRHG